MEIDTSPEAIEQLCRDIHDGITCGDILATDGMLIQDTLRALSSDLSNARAQFMKVSYEYDLDPRYGWASIDVTEDSNPLIMIHMKNGSRGYTVIDNELIPVCSCHARNENECACSGVDWSKEYE